MDTLILFPAEDAFALTAVDLLAALPGQPVTLAAVQTPAKQLAGGLAERVERVFTLPDWPFGPQKGIQPPDPGSPDHARIARFLRQGFDRVLVFDWSLAPLAALMPPGMGRFLVLDDWTQQEELVLSPDLKTNRTGPRLHEAEEIVADFDAILCTEQAVFSMIGTLFPDKALAAPVPIPGYPADLGEQWPLRFRAPNSRYDPYTQDGLNAFLRRQGARQHRGQPFVSLELPPDYAFVRDNAAPTPEPVLVDVSGPQAPLLEVSVQLHRPELRTRNAMRGGNLMFLLEARASGSPEDDYVIAPGGARAALLELLSDQTAWRAFWSQGVRQFREIQDHNQQVWVRFIEGRETAGGSFLYGTLGVKQGIESGAAPGGGDLAIVRAHAAAPLDPGPGLALVQTLLLQGLPERALAYLGVLMRAGAIAGQPVRASRALLDLMQRQSVFDQPRSRAVTDKLHRDLQEAGTDESGGLYLTFQLPEAVAAPPAAGGRGAPVFELGLHRDDQGARRFSGTFSMVYARQTFAGDPALVAMISGRLDDPDTELAAAQIEIDGQPVTGEITQRMDGSFFLPVPVTLQGESAGRDLFSVSVSLSALRGAAVAGRIDQIDVIRRAELFEDGRIAANARLLALLPTQDSWNFAGGYHIERSDTGAPVRWIQARATPELVWAATPPEQRPRGAVCAVVVVQTARGGPPPDELYLETPNGPLRAVPVPGGGDGARSYVFDITDLFIDRIRLPRLELVSPVPAETVGEDQRLLSLLLRSMSIVELPLSLLDNQPAVLTPGAGLRTGVGDPAAPPMLGKALRLALTVPHLLSPSRLVEIRGKGDDRIYGLEARLNRLPLEPVGISHEAGRFIWRGRLISDRPVLAFASWLQMQLAAEQPEGAAPMEITQVRFILPPDNQPGFELMDGGHFPGTAGYYHSGPAMRGVWAGPGGRLLVDVPAGADALWLAGDAAIGRSQIEAMTLSCDGAELECRTGTAADGRWRVTGRLEPAAEARIALVEIGSRTPVQGPVGLVRRAGCVLPSGSGE